MASREGQGMQIAVILFAILTVILAVTTYIYYAQAEKNEKARQEAVAQATEAKSAQNKVNYQLTALKMTLGIDNVGEAELTSAKNLAGGAEDTNVTKWIADFNSDMALFGDATVEGAKNYRTLPTYLLSSISRKNQSVVTSNTNLSDEQIQNKTQLESEQKRAGIAEAAQKTAETDYAAARNTFNETQANTKKVADDTAAALVKAEKDNKEKLLALQKERDQTQSQLATTTVTKDDFANRLRAVESEMGANVDNPDAHILWIDQKLRLVWIDKGYEDGLGRQMSFAVYSQNQASMFSMKNRMRKEGGGYEKVRKLDSKGRIEVVRIVGPHQAECRILEDHASDPILPGDWVHSPAWSPGQRLHFALMGFMDIDGDLESDRELVKNIITLNGGVIDTEIRDDGTRDTGKMSVNTRYVVVGDLSDKGNAGVKDATAFGVTKTAFTNEMLQYSVKKISVHELLDMMGWKPEEKTVGLGGNAADAGFRPRVPGSKAAPKAAAPPAAAPMTPEEKPMEEAPAKPGVPASPADPFGTK